MRDFCRGKHNLDRRQLCDTVGGWEKIIIIFHNGDCDDYDDDDTRACRHRPQFDSKGGRI